jgi:hypothetical protein
MLTIAGVVLLALFAPIVSADRACDIGMAPHYPPSFRLSLPPGYRFEKEQGFDTTLWRIWNPRGLDIHYDANDLPRVADDLATPPIATWVRHCTWDSGDGPLGLTRSPTDPGVVCSRDQLRDGHDYPAQVKAWFPDRAEFVAVVKSQRDLDVLLSIILTYTPGDYDHTLFPSGDAVQRAIAHGWNIRKCGAHLLQDAIYWEAGDVIPVLAKAGVDVNGLNSKGRPFLYQAEDQNAVDMIKVLFDVGARPVAIVDGKPQPPIWVAFAPTALNLFLEHGLDPNAVGDRGQTVLMNAACVPESATSLIARGARLESTNDAGDTALLLATRDGCLDGVSTLLQHGARKDVTDRTGRTPLMIATARVAGDQAFIAKYRDTPVPPIFVQAGVTVAAAQRDLERGKALVALLKGEITGSVSSVLPARRS